MHDLGGIVWAIIVFFAVVSSIVKSIKKAGTAAQGAQNANVAPRPRPASAPAPAYVPVHQQAFAPQPQAPPILPPVVPPPAQPPPVVRAAIPTIVARAQPEPSPALSHSPFPELRKGRPSFLGSRSALIRAVIASEVLGKPIALRDQA